MRVPKATTAIPSATPRHLVRQSKSGEAIAASKVTDWPKNIGDVLRFATTATRMNSRPQLASKPFRKTATISKRPGDD